MVCRVDLTTAAEEDAALAYEYIRAQDAEAADRWLIRLFDAIFSLAHMPRRCPRIPECEEIGRELRQLIFGGRRSAFRIIFDIVDVETDQPTVRVLRIWRGARRALDARDLDS